jgi:hypothetical protein
VVACGAELLGGVTGLDWFVGARFDGVLDPVPSSPSPLSCEREVVEPEVVDPEPVDPSLAWLADLEVPVCVVRPSPTAVPRALTTLSPARPAWRRRLRWM